MQIVMEFLGKLSLHLTFEPWQSQNFILFSIQLQNPFVDVSALGKYTGHPKTSYNTF